MTRSGNQLRSTIAAIAFLFLLVLQNPVFAGDWAGSRFKNGMVYGLTDIDQRRCRSSTGNLYGLENTDGQEIIPAKYSDIESCGHGLFLATDLNKKNKYYFGDDRHFFNRDGIELKFLLPPQTVLLNIFSFGAEADLKPDMILTELPSDAILHFGQDKKVENYKEYREGLCDRNGKILLAPIKGNILFVQPGQALVIPREVLKELVDLKSWLSTPTDLTPDPGVFPTPRNASPQSYYGCVFPADRKLKTVYTDDGKFDRDYWNDRRCDPISSIDMFNRFLHDYDLIGMSKSKVAELLLGGKYPPEVGYQSQISIPFSFISCTRWSFGIRIDFQNDCVSSWHFFDGEPMAPQFREGEPIKTNVVLGRLLVRGRGRGRTLQERIGLSGGNEPFPGVKAKDGQD